MKTSARLYLLPGLLCDAYVWHRQVDALADLSVHAVNGYGLADSLEGMAARVLETAPARFSLAGHSMGARVALEVFRAAPDRVERLALLDTGVHPRQAGEREKRQALLDLGTRRGIEALVDAWLPPMVHPARRDDEAFMRPIRQMCTNAGLETFEAQICALLGRDDQRPLLAAIRCPTLVATGSHDEWSPPAQHESIASAIDGATLQIFDGAGHMSPLETPEQVSDALRRWMQT